MSCPLPITYPSIVAQTPVVSSGDFPDASENGGSAACTGEARAAAATASATSKGALVRNATMMSGSRVCAAGVLEEGVWGVMRRVDGVVAGGGGGGVVHAFQPLVAGACIQAREVSRMLTSLDPGCTVLCRQECYTS